MFRWRGGDRMKYIQVDKSALIDYIRSSQKKRQEQKSLAYQWLTVFLNDPEVKDLINECDIKNLYNLN